MDLSYGPEYETFRDQVRDFLRTHRDRMPRAMGATRDETLAWQALLIAHGYAGRTIPKPYGGFGAEPDILKSRIVAEEFAAARAPMGLAGQGVSMLVPTLLELGTEAQKQRYLIPGLRADLCGAKAIPSPDPAPIWPRSPPGRWRMATTSWSTARRSGPPPPCRRT
jgi:alkylation response protein AidB-like acyl-CoA dehydrogenase